MAAKRATNKIAGSGALIKVDAQPPRDDVPPVEANRTTVAVARPTLFNAELEQLIDLIARDRVYRAMMAGLGRRLLMAPPNTGE